jgi:hypothetical protein
MEDDRKQETNMSNRAWETGNCDYCGEYNGHHEDDCPMWEPIVTIPEIEEERELVTWIDDGF